MKWDKFKEWNKKTLLPEDYKANNKIFMVAIGLVAVWLIVAAVQLPEASYFVRCGSDDDVVDLNRVCDNPFYNENCERLLSRDKFWCFEKTIPHGIAIGSKPGFFYEQAGLFTFLIMISSVLLNHFLYNKGYKFEGSEK